MRNEKNLDDGYVYFIRCGSDGPIKIGFSKHKSAEARLTTAQVYNPFTLTLVCVIPGGRRKEKDLHRQFDGYHIHGEWFEPNDGLITLIKSQEYIGSTVEDFRRIGAAHDNHHLWKGMDASDGSKRTRAETRYPITNETICQKCGIKKAHDRFHKDRDLDNIEPENILLVCRSCCMELDGRMAKLITMDHSHQIKPPQQCVICRKFSKGLTKGRCHACYMYYWKRGIERSTILDLD